MKLVPRCWDVRRVILLSLIVCGVTFPMSGSTLASDPTLPPSPPHVLTLQFPIGEPNALAIGDFDGDGRDDLFVVTEINCPRMVFTERWFEFSPNAEYAVRFYILPWQGEVPGEPCLIDTFPLPNHVLFGLPKTIPVVDLDSDGHLDVVMLLSVIPTGPLDPDRFLDVIQHHLLVFWGQGNGMFVRAQISLLPVMSAMAVGDFNLDGQLDIACLESRKLRLQIFYNRGDRNFIGPYFVELERLNDPCIPIGVVLRIAKVNETKPGDDIVVSGPCYYAKDRFGYFIRVISPCSGECWDVSPLLLIDFQVPSFPEAVWDLAVTDVDGDKHVDILLLGPLGITKEKQLMPDIHRGIYLLAGDGQGRFGPPQFIGLGMEGRFLYIGTQLEAEWTTIITILSFEQPEVIVLVVRMSKDFSLVQSRTVHKRRHVVTGAVVNQKTSRELVLLASLDLESEVTVIDVVRRW